MTALAAVRQFLAQPRSAQTPHLLALAKTVGDIEDIELIEAGPMPIFGFDIRERKGMGECHYCRCNAAGLAWLLLVVAFGQSLFINRTQGRPYLKAAGRMDEKAGTVVGRALANAEASHADDDGALVAAGDTVRYADGDTLNFTHRNLVLHEGILPTAKSGSAERHGDVLSRVGECPNALFPGSSAEKFDQAKAILHRAVERLQEERDAALRMAPEASV